MVRCGDKPSRATVFQSRKYVVGCLLVILFVGMSWGPRTAPVWGQEKVPEVAADSAAQHATSSETANLKASAGLDLKTLERLTKETLSKVAPAVVSVSGGSGVVVSEDGYVLTVAHVGMRPKRRITVTFPDGRRVRGRTLGNDHGVDAGLIKLDGDGPYPHVEMGHSKDLQPGEWCLAPRLPGFVPTRHGTGLAFGTCLAKSPGNGHHRLHDHGGRFGGTAV